jgi:RNA polymerase sigma-70 factor (ECF subfamily)
MTAPVPVADVSEAIRRAQAGDPDAFEIVYRANAGRVYALCLRMTADAAAASDLVQDVFVRAWEKLDTFRGDSAFSSWLHRLAVNVVLTARRASLRRSEDPLENEDGESPAEASVSQPGLTMDMEKAIASLPPMARQVLVLHDIEGYGHAEIGEMLGIAEGTCKAHCFRARRLLRERLER